MLIELVKQSLAAGGAMTAVFLAGPVARASEPVKPAPTQAAAAPAAKPAEQPATAPAERTDALRFNPHQFKLVTRFSGKVNYYSVVDEPSGAFIHASYRPPLETAVVAVQFPDRFQQGTRTLSWRWRAQIFPSGGNECVDGKGDSAAVVYLTWKRGLRWYSLKYVWSPLAPKGAVCDGKRNPFMAQDTIVLESGGKPGEWLTESINPDAEFRKHFEDGNPRADVPDLQGLGIMSDGDQTGSLSAADYADFTIVHR